MKERTKYFVLIGILLLIGCIIYFRYYTGPKSTETLVNSGYSEEEVLNDFIVVQVSGAVMKPGVYELVMGSRVYQAVALAGGTTTSAAIQVVNQAQTLEDGDHIHFPIQSIENTQADQKVNINTADITGLITIVGIGESKAKSIIEYREENGVFKSIEDLMMVDGIKEALFSKIEEYVTTY